MITKSVYNSVIRRGGVFISEIRSIDELHNHYDDIAAYCHKHQEPVFITNDEKIDLVVMSIETYQNLTNRLELYSQLKNGMDDIASDNTRLFLESMDHIKNRHR